MDQDSGGVHLRAHMPGPKPPYQRKQRHIHHPAQEQAVGAGNKHKGEAKRSFGRLLQ